MKTAITGKKFTAAPIWRFFGIFWIVIFITLGISTVHTAHTNIETSLPGVIFTFLLALFFIILGTAYLSDFFFYSIQITATELIENSLFKRKVYDLSTITGFSVNSAPLYREVVVHTTKNDLAIPLIMKESAALHSWFEERYINFDKRNQVDELQDIMINSDLGDSDESRIALLAKARRWAKSLAILAGTVGVWSIVHPKPYLPLLWTLTLLPLIALLSVHHFRGVLTLDGNHKSIYPNVGLPLILPGLVLMLRAIVDTHPINLTRFLMPGFTVSAMVWILMMICDRGTLNKLSKMISLLPFAIITGLGIVAVFNEEYDNSTPEQFRREIVTMRVEQGSKSTTRFITIYHWDLPDSLHEMSVRKETYEQLSIGDSISVNIKSGRFNVPWYYVSRLDTESEK